MLKSDSLCTFLVSLSQTTVLFDVHTAKNNPYILTATYLKDELNGSSRPAYPEGLTWFFLMKDTWGKIKQENSFAMNSAS